MSDDNGDNRPFLPPPVAPIPSPLPPNNDSASGTEQKVKRPAGPRPFEGHYYQISRKNAIGDSVLELTQDPWNGPKQLFLGDTLIIHTACASPCWLYVIESDTEEGTNRLKVCSHTDGTKSRHEYNITDNFDKLRIIFTDDEVPDLAEGSITLTKKTDQPQDNWLSNLDRFNPSGEIGGRGHGAILTPEENSMAPRFSFEPNPNDIQLLQTKFLLRRLPSGYFLNVQVTPRT